MTLILHRDDKIVGAFPVSDAKPLKKLLINYLVVRHHCAESSKPLLLSLHKNNFVLNLKRKFYLATTLIWENLNSAKAFFPQNFTIYFFQ